MPLAALGTRIELYAASPASATWDRDLWDAAQWGTLSWQDVTPESMAASMDWGTDRVVGLLSVAAAGRISIQTYDPARILDPANQASPYWFALRPGTPFRVTYGGQVVRSGFLDSVSYAQAGDQGRLEGSDGIALLAQARFAVTDMAGAPTTLRALARWMVAAKSLPITVEADPTGPEVIDHPGAEGFPGVYNVPPPGWAIASGAGTFGTSNGAPRTGGLAYNARGPVDANNAALNSVQTVTPGGTYRLSGWRFREGFGDGQVTVYLHQYRADGSYIGNTSTGPMYLVWAPGLNDSTYYYREVVGALDPACAMVGVAITSQAGSDWVDDLSLTQVMPTVPVSAPPTSEVSAWDWLVLAATDTLTAVWVDPLGAIRFRAYGDPRDNGLTIGGAAGMPVQDISVTASADGVWNRATCARPAGGAVAAATDTGSIARFGERLVARDRPAPDPDGWVASVIADRAAASLDWRPTTIRLQTVQDLTDLVALGMVDVARILVDSAVPPISATARVLGGHLEVTWPDGWSARVVAYVPSTDWRNDQTPPVPPINPSPPPTQRVVRTYASTQSARVSLTSGGAKYGAGQAAQIPVGAWSGWQNRGLFAFPAIPWGDVVAVVSARVLYTTSTQVNVGFGSSPKVTQRRITAGWSEGSLSSPGSANAVVWPGPGTSSTGAVTAAVTGSQQTRFAIDATAIARAWAPSAAGGSGSPYYGVALYSAGESNGAYTTEVWSDEYGTAGSRPVLELTLDVLA